MSAPVYESFSFVGHLSLHFTQMQEAVILWQFRAFDVGLGINCIFVS
jgi:hypothetical protein